MVKCLGFSSWLTREFLKVKADKSQDFWICPLRWSWPEYLQWSLSFSTANRKQTHCCAAGRLYKVSIPKCKPGSGFQILFKFECFIFINKCDVGYKGDRSFIPCIMNFMAVVFEDSSINICCTSSIKCTIRTLNNIYKPHRYKFSETPL